MEGVHKYEQLPSGKVIVRHLSDDGLIIKEQHTYGMLDIGITLDFREGAKVDETYFSKRRLVSRRTYEVATLAYPDMPPADNAIEDGGKLLLQAVRQQRVKNKAEAERRLAESAESPFPRPASTNWLRVISGEQSHLVVFASRDWKVLARDPRNPIWDQTIPTGREWLKLFGFYCIPGQVGSVSKGLEVGYEVTGNREAMLKASRLLLIEANTFVAIPLEASLSSGLIRSRSKPKRKPPLAWPSVLPPLIDFLSGLHTPTVKIFNHHR